MVDMSKWTNIPSDKILEETSKALKSNGVNVQIAENKDEAKNKVLELIPKSSEVMTMTSATLDEVGILREINESGDYNSVRSKLNSMDRATQGTDMQKLGAAPEYVVGSVQAITQDGKILMASNTGSQLSAYVYGSPHVIWVVGGQKVVKDLDEGIKRIYDYVLPLESKRVQIAYGMAHSDVNKLLVINKEVKPDRLTVILVKEPLGF